MTKKWNIFGIAAAIICFGAGALIFLKSHEKLGRAGVKVLPVAIFDEKGQIVATNSVGLPEQVLGCSSSALPVGDQELKFLPKDTTYGRRLYEDANGRKAMISVVLMGTDRTSIHKPEFCLPGQGWSILTQQSTTIKMNQPVPYDLPVMKWVIGQTGKDNTGADVEARGLYVFWFVSGNAITPYHSGRISSQVKNLVTKGELERWAYVAYFSVCSPGEEDATFERLQRLIQASVPEFQLTTGHATSLPAGEL